VDADRSIVLVIDVQVKLLPLIRNWQGVVTRVRQLVDGVRILGVPVLVTEQYPKGLGGTDPSVRQACEKSRAEVIEKPTFSAWAEPRVREAMERLDRTQVIVTGIETHVCVQQTALDLRSRDFEVFVCADAVGSRGRIDHETGLDRMRQGGVWVTTVESILFELCQRCDTEKFKTMLEVIKANPPSD